MLQSDGHAALISRLEKAMRPLSERGHGPDHDRLRERYISLLERCTGDPLERARSTVLQEILSTYTQTIPPAFTDPHHAAIQHARAAIGALATTICRLEEQNNEAAAVALENASQAFLAMQECLAAPLSQLPSALRP